MKKVLQNKMFFDDENQLCDFINEYNINKEDIQAIISDRPKVITIFFWGDEDKCCI